MGVPVYKRKEDIKITENQLNKYEFSQNPGHLEQAIQFEQDLRDLKTECGGVTGCVLPGHRTLPAKDARKEFPEEIYELAFDKPPTLEALDATWQAVHKVVKKHLK